jgi:hypothetical protein
LRLVPEHEPQGIESCAICGRTILRGERVADYVTADGERHQICALCKDRAEAAGWTPAEHAAEHGRPVPRRSRGRAFRGALSRAAERMRQPRSEPGMDPVPEEAPVREPEHSEPERPARTRLKAPSRSKAAAKPNPKARAKPEAKEGEAAKRKRAPSPEARMRRALDRFNESEQSRTVAALTKSLGEPRASVQTVSAKPPKVTVTVAWELSWYRWEVSQDGDKVSVTEVAKGDSVDELTDKAKRWNASVDGDGNVQLRTASKQRATANAE